MSLTPSAVDVIWVSHTLAGNLPRARWLAAVAVCLQCLQCRFSAGLLYLMRLFFDLLLPRVGCQPGPAFMQLLASEFAPLQIDWHFCTYCVLSGVEISPTGCCVFSVHKLCSERLCRNTCLNMTTQAIAILMACASNQGSAQICTCASMRILCKLCMYQATIQGDI